MLKIKAERLIWVDIIRYSYLRPINFASSFLLLNNLISKLSKQASKGSTIGNSGGILYFASYARAKYKASDHTICSASVSLKFSFCGRLLSNSWA